jgi:hypothetical protein
MRSSESRTEAASPSLTLPDPPEERNLGALPLDILKECQRSATSQIPKRTLLIEKFGTHRTSLD